MAWELVLNKKLNQDYRGPAEWCHWTFTVNLPDQMGTIWTAKQSLNAHIEKLAEEGSIILEYRLWEDREPTWTTDYYVEVVASASPIWWTPIIIGVLVILAIIATYFVIRETGEIAEYIGEAAPVTLPLMAIAVIGALTIAGIYLVRRERKPVKGGKT